MLNDNLQLNNLDNTLPFKERDMQSEYMKMFLMTEIIKMKLDRVLKQFDKKEDHLTRAQEEIFEKSPT